jgi:hypothetical protein
LKGVARSKLRDALKRGNDHARNTHDPDTRAHAFQDGAHWVQQVLIPAITEGNAELEPEHVGFQLDLNLDSRSTNHAHADFWVSEIKEGQRAVGPRYSINVLGGRNVWLYKHGAPGKELGTTDRCGSAEIRALLLEAAEEFGRAIG